jgi:hypothetical protein
MTTFRSSVPTIAASEFATACSIARISFGPVFLKLRRSSKSVNWTSMSPPKRSDDVISIFGAPGNVNVPMPAVTGSVASSAVPALTLTRPESDVPRSAAVSPLSPLVGSLKLTASSAASLIVPFTIAASRKPTRRVASKSRTSTSTPRVSCAGRTKNESVASATPNVRSIATVPVTWTVAFTVRPKLASAATSELTGTLARTVEFL